MSSINRLSEDVIDLDGSESDSNATTKTLSDRSSDSQRTSAILATKFMENFDPETSVRERRKLSRKLNSAGLDDTFRKKYQNALYDEYGIHIPSGKDLCDCLNVPCAGCFFPCPKCRSTKCGNECRVRRKFVYDYIEFEGSEQKIKNPYGTAK